MKNRIAKNDVHEKCMKIDLCSMNLTVRSLAD